ncbi:MAG TPA: MFS transporter [Candidatus Omnitrophica bacterium]|nr:MFS transporter [Candidatus Omnitrophota bacterium]
MKLRYISEQRQLIKSFYVGIGKTAVIFPSAFLVAIGSGLMGLGMVFYMRDVLNASPSQIGLLAALWSFSYILGCIFIRPLLDRLLPRYTLVIATFCMYLFTTLIHYVGSIISVYVLYSLYGFSTSLFWPPLMGWFSRNIEGTELSKTISKFNLSWSIGLIISPFLAGWLSEKTPRMPLYSGSGLFLLTGFMIIGAILVLPGIRKDRDTELSSRVKNREKGKDTPIRYPAWVGLFTTYVVTGMILNIFPISAREDLLLSKSVIGLLLLSRALFTTSGFVILGRTTFWHFKTLPMLLGQVFLMLLLIVMVYTPPPFLMGFILGLMGLFIALGYSYSLFHGASGSINRAKRMAIHESLLSAGLISGASVGGMLYERYSMATVYWFCSALVLIGVLLQAGFCLRAKRIKEK